jgi:hypothetical protein
MSESSLPANQRQPTELAPLEIIRTETVLSRFPIHNLSKTGKVDIRINKKNEKGQVELRWEVSYNERYGQARQLAYKVDTIFINQRIDELGRPLPKIIRLGSLRDIASELGFSSPDTAKVKEALIQNATAAITAKLTYKDRNGQQRELEAVFTRYSLIFTGEKLPGGTKADGVYLILNDPYWEVLNAAPDRPLDYGYLRSLPPTAQRFYEILSFRIFTAIKYRQPYARILYSEYCMYSAQQRHYDYEHVKKQLYKLHRPHKQSGYLAEITFEPIVDAEGKSDWTLLYKPGPKAVAEYETFHQKKATDEGAGELVRYFYRVFHDIKNADPQLKEMQQARQLIREHGLEKARYLIDFCHRVSPESNYRPQLFGGILSYLTRALDDYQKKEQTRQRMQARKQQQQEEERRSQEEKVQGDRIAQMYLSLPIEEQDLLHEQARTNLLAQGIKEEFLLEAAVKQEIYRIMREQGGDSSA